MKKVTFTEYCKDVRESKILNNETKSTINKVFNIK